MQRRLCALSLAMIIVSVSLSGCLFSSNEKTSSMEEETPYVSILDRHTLEWKDNHTFSYTLETGPYYALDVKEIDVDVDTSDIWETGPAMSSVHLSYWLPSNTLEGEEVPVIAIISPYFSYGSQGDESPPTNVVSAGRGEFIFENFVPHGYAFAQVSVFGTELSTGCFDYRGAGEGLGIHSAVEWLGSQNWSNGNVGLYGKSYEGATQWEAAALGSEYLKTIVPISGTTALHPLLYKNGSAEARSQVMHMNYFSSTVDYNGDDLDNICPDIIEGLFAGPITYGAGELDPYMSNYYDERSHIDKAFKNWNGSVYWVQGLQDWNVDPHQVFGGPIGINWYQDYIDSGYEIRGILGQWEHNYPDQWTKHNAQDSGYGGEAIHNMTRWDWAQDLFEWYEYYLKGNGPQPESIAQVQRNDGQWRIEQTWPPEDIEWHSLPLSECSSSGAFTGGGAPVVGGGQTVTTTCSALSETEDIKISGLIRLHLEAVATMDGGQIFAELRDSETGIRLGHATMDIRYHAGGYEPQTVLPSQQLTMMMEFQAIDALLPAGHGINIVFTDTGEDYLAPACGPSCTIHILPSLSEISIPHINRDSSNILITPQSPDAANN
jgi:predicted acyl esterase|tara:strand:+ start:6796 stop:8610 length:1815 start_codon:yes stop_codon:yes gene_type:complete